MRHDRQNRSFRIPGYPNLPLLLWSTNTWLKHRIQQLYCGDRHYVWCSGCFESSALPKYAIGGSLPPSSDPAAIYRDLHSAVTKNDGHCSKIAEQKKTLMGLAVEWQTAGKISEEDQNEILAMVSKAAILDWRPLVFVIPYQTVATRVKVVPREKRASQELEYIIEDLAPSEFEIIEPH